jgi:hypothetical protein
VAIYNESGVPVLNLSDDSRSFLKGEHEKAIDAWQAATADADLIEELRLGERVFVHNKAPLNAPDGVSDITMFIIGAATLDEAIKDVVGGFDTGHVKVGDHVNTPDWVSSTDGDLARLLAEHYTRASGNDCQSRDVSEVALPLLPEIGATRVAVGRDIESAAAFQWATMYAGSSTTAPTATTFTTDTVNIPVNSIVGQLVVRLDATAGNRRIGIAQSNTSAANSVITIDRWYDPTAMPANRGIAAAATPAAGGWCVVPGNAPCSYVGLTANNSAAGDGDTVLTGEIVTAGGGLIRQLATYAHTVAGTTTTLTNTWTANGTDALPVTVAKIGVFQGVEAASRMFFETLLNAVATLSTSGDQLQVTETVTL